MEILLQLTDFNKHSQDVSFLNATVAELNGFQQSKSPRRTCESWLPKGVVNSRPVTAVPAQGLLTWFSM
jgi:hypothetical protein